MGTRKPTRKVRRRLRLYSPHMAQLNAHMARKRFKVLAWGRQSGKSTWGLNELISQAWKKPLGTYWFISPTYAQAKVQYRRLMRALRPSPGAVLHTTLGELMIILRNGSVIWFKSGEVLDDLRGETLDGVVIDEVREQHPDLWSLVVRPMLATTKGWAVFISTPNGFDAFYDFAEKAKFNEGGNWFFSSVPSTANPGFSKQEVEECRLDMTEAEFSQEIMAEFREIKVSRTYWNYSVSNEEFVSPFGHGEGTESELICPWLPIEVAMDFNLNPMAWSLGQAKARDSYWFDEIHIDSRGEEMGTPAAAAELVDMVKDHEAGLVVVGDATGKSGQRAAGGKSDYDIVFNALKEAGIHYVDKTPKANPFIKDRINTMNNSLKDAKGRRHLFLHPKRCKFLRQDFIKGKFKKGAKLALDPGPKMDIHHSADGVGYHQCERAPIKRVGNVGRMRVIRR